MMDVKGAINWQQVQSGLGGEELAHYVDDKQVE